MIDYHCPSAYGFLRLLHEYTLVRYDVVHGQPDSHWTGARVTNICGLICGGLFSNVTLIRHFEKTKKSTSKVLLQMIPVLFHSHMVLQLCSASIQVCRYRVVISTQQYHSRWQHLVGQGAQGKKIGRNLQSMLSHNSPVSILTSVKIV